MCLRNKSVDRKKSMTSTSGIQLLFHIECYSGCARNHQCLCLLLLTATFKQRDLIKRADHLVQIYRHCYCHTWARSYYDPLWCPYNPFNIKGVYLIYLCLILPPLPLLRGQRFWVFKPWAKIVIQGFRIMVRKICSIYMKFSWPWFWMKIAQENSIWKFHV